MSNSFYLLRHLFLSFLLLYANLYACRLWGIISVGDNIIPNAGDSLQLVQSESQFFEQLGSNYLDGWSIAYYNQSYEFSGIHRSDTTTSSDSIYQQYFNQILNPENNAKIMLGHLRAGSSGATNIPNPHPFLFEYNNKTYSFMHNGTLSKTILISLLTENNTDSTWINNNPPNTFNGYDWFSESGWSNVIDSELFMLWIMKNIQLESGDELENLIYSLQQLEIAEPNADKNFILSNGEIVYAYASQVYGTPDLYYSDQTPIQYGDSTITPHFLSIMSEIPPDSSANQLNWLALSNEVLLVADAHGNHSLVEDFINRAPNFTYSELSDTLGVGYDKSYELYITDIDADTLTLYLENNPEWAEIDNGQLFLSPQEDGTFSFNVIVSDGELTDTLQCVITVGHYRPVILSITDVLNDGGGWVYVEFSRSYWDTEENRNTEIYHIERFTSEEWISVGSSAAYNSDYYIVQVATEDNPNAENSGMNTFRVVASMDEGTWISLPDSGYSIDNNLDLIDDITIPSNFSLLQNYPNPFNSNTIVRYHLPEKSRLSIIIYDILGQQVKELIDGYMGPGYKIVNWDGKNDLDQPTSSGIYFIRMEADNYNKTKMIVLSK